MNTALIVIDVQESFRHRPYFTEHELPAFLAAQNALISGSLARVIPALRVLHRDGPDEPGNPFALASCHVKTLAGLVAEIESARGEANLSSAIRVFVLAEARGSKRAS